MTTSSATRGAGKVVGFSVIAHDITARRSAQRALQTSQRQLSEAQRIAGLGSFEFDLATGQMTWSTGLYQLLGLDPSLGPDSDAFTAAIHPEDRAAATQAWADATQRGVPVEADYRITRPDMQVRNVHTRAVPQVAADGTVIKLGATVLDDTDRVGAERARRAAETRFETGFEQAGIGAAIVALDGVPARVNRALCALMGRPGDLLIGRLWTEYTHPEETPLWQVMAARVAAGHDTYAAERRYLRPDGSVVWASVNVTVVRDGSGEPQHFLAQYQDITGRRQLEQKLAHQALHDALTGLPNRALLEDRLVQGLARTRANEARLAVMFLDMDHFKMVNESLGHASGDDLLMRAAARLTRVIRPGDTVARFGGDEFVVVCDDLCDQETERIAARILETLSRPFLISHQEINITASLGIVASEDQATPGSLLRDADAAMYLAKQRGRGRHERFDEVLRAKADRRLAADSALHHALERDELTVYYQPVVDLTTGAMVSAEALLRWEHPGRGMVLPGEFIPLAEETGLIVPIGAWVLEQACQQLVEWQRCQPSMTVAVNLSVRQILAPDIDSLIHDVLTRTGVRPEHLCLELTESVFMEDVDYFARTLADLKTLGVQLSIDDFGTGYSSLSYLKRFPVDAVKLDRAFIDGLGTEPHDSALVAAIIAMADALGLQVIAEGVETQDQLATLTRLQCQQAQGFYLCRPISAAEMASLVAKAHHWQVEMPPKPTRHQP